MSYSPERRPSSSKPSPKPKKGSSKNLASEPALPSSSTANSHLFESDSDDDLFTTNNPVADDSPKVHTKNLNNDLKKKAESIASVLSQNKSTVSKLSNRADKSDPPKTENAVSKADPLKVNNNSKLEKKLDSVTDSLQSDPPNMGGYSSLFKRSNSNEENVSESSEPHESTNESKDGVESEAKKSIFDDDSDDEDLFSPQAVPKPTKPNTIIKGKGSMTPSDSVSAQELFHSTSDDTDIIVKPSIEYNEDKINTSGKERKGINVEPFKYTTDNLFPKKKNDASQSISKPTKEKSLFSESSDDDDMDDLFASVNKTKGSQSKLPVEDVPEIETAEKNDLN